MARNHARVHTGIWQDADFRKLPPSVQRLYLFLLSQPNLSHLGVLPLTLRRWTQAADGYSLNELRADLDRLIAAQFVVVDDDAEELLIRSLLRNDGVYKQPNVMRAAIASAPTVQSEKIKRMLLQECARIDSNEVAEGLLEKLREALAVPNENPPESDPETLPGTLPDGFGEPEQEPPTHTRARPLVLSPSPTPSSREVRPARPDLTDAFVEFWSAYPRREGKGAAEKSYERAVKAGADPPTVLDAARAYARRVEGRDPKFTAMPATWLNQRRWEDDPPPAFSRVSDGQVSLPSEEYEKPGVFGVPTVYRHGDGAA